MKLEMRDALERFATLIGQSCGDDLTRQLPAFVSGENLEVFVSIAFVVYHHHLLVLHTNPLNFIDSVSFQHFHIFHFSHSH